MHKRFLPNNYKHDLYLEVTSLSQECMSVEEYTRGFEKLQIKNGLEEEPKCIMARFLRGLDPNIVQKAELQLY